MREFLLKSTTALAALLLSASLASATNVVTLYERTASTWTDADLTEWVNDNAQYVTQTIDGGLKMTAKNSGWNSTKNINFSENTIITITSTLNGHNAGGNKDSYDFLSLGDISVRLNGQDQKAELVIGSTTKQISNPKANRGTDFNIIIELNQATKNAKIKLTGGSNLDASLEGSSEVTAVPTNIVVGHYKAGRENYEISETLKSIKVTEEQQVVETSEYTIVYKVGEDVIKSDTKTGVVGETIALSSAEIANFFVGDKKYIVVSNNAAEQTIAADGTTVVTVTCREAATYSYTVKSNNPEKELSKGIGYEGDNISVFFPRYILKEDGTLSEKASYTYGKSEFSQSFTLTQDNQIVTVTYNNTLISNVVYLAEAEDIEGMISSANQANRTSNGLGAYCTDNVTATTLEPGWYTLTVATRTQQATNFDFLVANAKAGEDNTVLTVESPNGSTGGGVSEPFPVDYGKPTPLVIKQAGGVNNLIDYLYVQKTGDVTTGVDEVSVDAETANDAWYNLQGIQVAEPTATGIYIHNGKKIFIRK